MTLAAAQKKLTELFDLGEVICATAKTADRNGQALGGHGFYGKKFHAASLKLHRLENEFLKLVGHAELGESLTTDFKTSVDVLRSTISTLPARIEHLRKLRTMSEAQILPRLEGLNASPVPETEQVLPMDVVRGTRGYFEKCILQANGCYERQWFDSCAVMIRKFLELLIIEVYEANGREADIKDGHGNYFMLRDLVDRMSNDTSWNLGRNAKTGLPSLKNVGDLSAHSRRYFARKQDIDQNRDALRVIADELLHLAKIR